MNNQKKVLVVEDDVFLSDIYKSKLTLQKLNVIIANDGEEAIKMAQEEMPQLIILDILLPKKNGIEVLEVLKKMEKTKNIPVIIASNLDQTETGKKGMGSGADDYFIKSEISLEELSKVCAKYLQ